MELARALKSVGRAGACIALLYHMLATAVYNLPKTTSLGDSLHTWTEPYARYFGLWQEWDMFSTIPWFQQLDATLLVTDETGAITEHPPVLPGLKPSPGNLRFAAVWLRLVSPNRSQREYAERYFANACRAAAAALNRSVRSVQLRVDAQRLRRLAQIRRDAIMAKPQTHTSRAFQCPR